MASLDLGLRILVEPDAVRAYLAECEKIDRQFAGAEEHHKIARALAFQCAEEALFESCRVEGEFT